MRRKKESIVIDCRKILNADSLKNIRQFIQFSFIGGTGVVVNSLVVFVMTALAHTLLHISENDAIANILFTRFNIRIYHLITVIAFLVANLWNYSLNRRWAFKTSSVSWLQGMSKFMLAGIAGLIASLFVTTIFMHKGSPFYLSNPIFDSGSFIFNRFYLANILSIVASTPVNFIINKLWTFRMPKTAAVPAMAVAPSNHNSYH